MTAPWVQLYSNSGRLLARGFHFLDRVLNAVVCSTIQPSGLQMHMQNFQVLPMQPAARNKNFNPSATLTMASTALRVHVHQGSQMSAEAVQLGRLLAAVTWREQGTLAVGRCWLDHAPVYLHILRSSRSRSLFLFSLFKFFFFFFPLPLIVAMDA
ncbi:hypothetical protein JOL62DRAFT_576218 [Phyllosticta paracitricarpa]|uniref:Uncharacterized protein n=2 Tax=Phyllosticta TaxID=121621 RepID=A0ABR1MFE2_9PEZI